MELGPEDVSLLERCPHLSSTGNSSLVETTSIAFHPTMETPPKTEERMTMTFSVFW